MPTLLHDPIDRSSQGLLLDHGSPRHSWNLTRNCAMVPGTFFCNLAALASLSSVIGLGFWIAGYPLVMFFCGAQSAALGVAVLAYARHATDGERVRIEQGRVQVETTQGGRVAAHEFNACWARLLRDRSGGLVLRSGSAVVPLGRQLTPADRDRFAREFAASLVSSRREDGRVRPESASR
ncbi:MAG: DUF2244 domain-containing protein [Comamonadaceae bacterium]|nr:MAG: DUF2244 domain-containing protein [Comamonadaceae bacterium]